MSKNWSKGSTATWRKTRAAVLRANESENRGQCVLAIPNVCSGRATQVHHSRPRSEVGDNPRFLLPTCQPCNNRVSDPASTPTHTLVVQWVRDHAPTTIRAVRAAHPHVEPAHVSVIMSRAIKRGELERIGRGVYRAGPTGLPPITSPQPRRVSKW